MIYHATEAAHADVHYSPRLDDSCHSPMLPHEQV